MHKADQTSAAQRDVQAASATLEPATGATANIQSPDSYTGSLEDDKSAEQRGGPASL